MEIEQKILERKVGFVELTQMNDVQVHINQMLMRLDLVAHRMEVRWGTGRLQDLASDLMRSKWQKQMERLGAAVLAGDAGAVNDLVEGCLRGWAALEKEAEVAGHVPYPPYYWEISVDGELFWVARGNEDAQGLYGRCGGAQVVTVEELVRIWQQRHRRALGTVPEAMEGEFKEDPTRRMDEEIPF